MERKFPLSVVRIHFHDTDVRREVKEMCLIVKSSL